MSYLTAAILIISVLLPLTCQQEWLSVLTEHTACKHAFGLYKVPFEKTDCEIFTCNWPYEVCSLSQKRGRQTTVFLECVRIPPDCIDQLYALETTKDESDIDTTEFRIWTKRRAKTTFPGSSNPSDIPEFDGELTNPSGGTNPEPLLFADADATLEGIVAAVDHQHSGESQHHHHHDDPDDGSDTVPNCAETNFGCSKPQSEQGIDLNNRCCEWAKRGECTTNSKWMCVNCQKSCFNQCTGNGQSGQFKNQQPISQTGNCRNKQTNCQYWAQTGQCKTNPYWMKSNCQASCTNCGKDYETQEKPGCVDKNDLCAFWSSIGECKINDLWMRKNCKLSCGEC